MLNLYNDRLDYGRLIAPPYGYKLDFAVATTYSLDMDALIGVCLSLSFSTDTDSSLLNNPIYLIQSLRNVSNKLAIFCEDGQIKVPPKLSDLYILLENIVFPIKPHNSKYTKYPSFHPKIWLIRYKNKNHIDQFKYRIIVLSRNLTFDRSWDVAFYMDGIIDEKQKHEENKPISNFLEYLANKMQDSVEKKSKITELVGQVTRIKFDTESKEFRDFEFLPIGINSADPTEILKTELFTKSFHELLIISPFLSDDIIQKFIKNRNESKIQKSEYILITRQSSLNGIKSNDIKFDKIYTLNDQIIDGEMQISSDDNDLRNNSNTYKHQDIHAKIYMTRNNSKSNIYIGSLNATHNSIYGNIEFMIRLGSYRKHINLESLKKSLLITNEQNSPFKLSEPESTDETLDASKQKEMNNIIRELSRNHSDAEVIKENDSIYKIKISIEILNPINNNYSITIRPLLAKPDMELDYMNEIVFNNLEIMELSNFYIIKVVDKTSEVQKVVIINTKNLPKERDKLIVTNKIKTKDDFYSYLNALLCDSSTINTLRLQKNISNNKDKTINCTSKHNLTNFYETLLHAAVNNPKDTKIEIDYLLKSLQKEIITDEFKNLFEAFKKAVSKK